MHYAETVTSLCGNILSNELRRAPWMERATKAWQGTSLFKCLEPRTVPLMCAWPFNVPVKIHDGVLLSLHHGIEVKLWMRYSLLLTHIPSLSLSLSVCTSRETKFTARLWIYHVVRAVIVKHCLVKWSSFFSPMQIHTCIVLHCVISC